MIVSRGLEEKVELMNDRFTALFGYTMDDVPDVACWWPLAYPDEAYRQAVRTEWQARVGKAIRNGTDIAPMEVTVRCKDGSTRYVEAHLSCMGETNLVTLIDLTERKLAEESLADVGRKLIEAQEQERTWIARELHDDVNQRMALLAIELDRLNQQLPPSAVGFHDRIQHASQRLSEIAKDIQALSHRLHSSKLEYLGLVAAANSFCKDLSEQRKVEIDFSHTAIPRSVPKEISLCLFRVLQETLQNAVKHSGVRHYKVELHGTEGEIQLTVSDGGVGFDPQDAIHSRGLGLISMRERMQLVSGEFSIKSHPGSGTTIHARVPFSSSINSRQVAG
jgi:PAS domain S-box-containing protein